MGQGFSIVKYERNIDLEKDTQDTLYQLYRNKDKTFYIHNSGFNINNLANTFNIITKNPKIKFSIRIKNDGTISDSYVKTPDIYVFLPNKYSKYTYAIMDQFPRYYLEFVYL